MKTKEKTYAELLREIKQSARNSGESVEAKTIRETRDGNLLIVVDGGKEEADSQEQTREIGYCGN